MLGPLKFAPSATKTKVSVSLFALKLGSPMVVEDGLQ